MSMDKLPIPHSGQILTNKKTILYHIREIENTVSKNTVLLIAMGADTPDYYLRL